MCIRRPCRRSGCAPQSTYKLNYPPAPAYLCAALRNTFRAFISPPFCVLGSWDSRDISFITPSSFMLQSVPICLAFLGSRFPNFSLPYVLLVVHSVVGLFISFLADLPSFFIAFHFLLFPVYACINIDSAYSSDYRIASYPSPLCYNQTLPLFISSFPFRCVWCDTGFPVYKLALVVRPLSFPC